MITTRSPLRISLGGGGTDLPSYYREHGGFLVRLPPACGAARGRPQLLSVLPHRCSFVVRESLERLAGRGGGLGEFLLSLLCWFLFSHSVRSLDL